MCYTRHQRLFQPALCATSVKIILGECKKGILIPSTPMRPITSWVILHATRNTRRIWYMHPPCSYVKMSPSLTSGISDARAGTRKGGCLSRTVPRIWRGPRLGYAALCTFAAGMQLRRGRDRWKRHLFLSLHGEWKSLIASGPGSGTW